MFCAYCLTVDDIDIFDTFCIKVVRNKKSKFFSHRYSIEFYETN